MDSHAVNKQIREHIRPGLKNNGFTVFTSRSAWRYRKDRIDVINFQSFNSYLAESLGCTTYSFSVNLGCYLTYIPQQRLNMKAKNGLLLPAEYDCPLRGRLKRRFRQSELRRKDIWYIDDKGRYLTRCMQDVNEQIQRAAFPWFDKLGSDKHILRILLEEPEDTQGVWGFGANPSPIRSFLSGFVALHLGQYVTAKEKLREVYESECFLDLKDLVKQEMDRLQT